MLDGFTYAGRIPAAFAAVPVPGAPGALLAFPGQNIVTDDGAARFYEILIKLPHAAVTPVTAAGQMREVATAGLPSPPWVAPVDAAIALGGPASAVRNSISRTFAFTQQPACPGAAADFWPRRASNERRASPSSAAEWRKGPTGRH